MIPVNGLSRKWLLTLCRSQICLGVVKGGCSNIHTFEKRNAIPCGHSRIRESFGNDRHASTQICMIDKHGVYGVGIQVYLTARGVVEPC